jgi:hypothetical protein
MSFYLLMIYEDIIKTYLDHAHPFVGVDYSSAHGSGGSPPLLFLTSGFHHNQVDNSKAYENVLLLLERGANPDIRDAQGNSCLYPLLKGKVRFIAVPA